MVSITLAPLGGEYRHQTFHFYFSSRKAKSIILPFKAYQVIESSSLVLLNNDIQEECTYIKVVNVLTRSGNRFMLSNTSTPSGTLYAIALSG